MEKVEIVTKKHGRKTRHAKVCIVGGICFAICPVKQSKSVVFAMPGAGEFIEVRSYDWDGNDKSLNKVIDEAIDDVITSNPPKWVDTYSDIFLTSVRQGKNKAHREYLLALLDEYKAFNGEDWK